MSLFDYEASKMIIVKDPPFYGLIMAAMRKADSNNLFNLKIAFPAVWVELHERYNAPGGVLEGDQPT